MESMFWIVFAVMFVAICLLDRFYGMLRDITTVAAHQPYSWSRVQLAWWTLIILSCFTTILMYKGVAPTLDISTVVLLGISAATTATARMIDISDAEKDLGIRHQNNFGKNFFLDILSDESGISIHRFQTLVFNGVFGIWFINAFLHNIPVNDCSLYLNDGPWLAGCKINPVNFMIPPISQNNLILLGLSSATYAALKTQENRSATVNASANLIQPKDPALPLPGGAAVQATKPKYATEITSSRHKRTGTI